MNLNNVEERKSDIKWRQTNLEITKWCLEHYKKTGNKEYFNWAKIFGEWSAKIKREYLT